MGSDKWINLCIQYQEKCLQTSQSFWDSRFWEKWFDSRLPSSRLKVWDSNSFSQNLESKKLCKLFRVFWIQDFKDLSLSLSYVLVPSCFIFLNMYNYIIYIYVYVYIYIYRYIYWYYMIDIPSTECLILSLTLRGFWWHPAAPSRRTSPSAVSTWPTLCRTLEGSGFHRRW